MDGYFDDRMCPSGSMRAGALHRSAVFGLNKLFGAKVLYESSSALKFEFL